MIYIYSIFYGLYLFFFMDTLLEVPKFWLQERYSLWFFLGSSLYYVILLGINLYKKKDFWVLLRREITSLSTFTFLIVFFLFQLGRNYTNHWVIYHQFVLIGNIYMVSKIYGWSDKKNLFLIFTYIFTSIFILYYLLIYKFPYDYFYNNLKHLFSSGGRRRFSFGFNSPNTLGNMIVSVLLCGMLSLFSVFRTKINIFVKFLYGLVDFAIIFILLCMLVCTCSRNSILALISFIVVFAYFVFTGLFKNKAIRFSSKIIIVTVFLLVSILFLKSDGYDFFKDSGRLANFEKNSYLLSNKDIKLFGIGVPYYGDFGANKFDFSSYNIDNFYLYLYVCTGIVGCVVFFVSFLSIGFRLYRYLYKYNSVEVKMCLSIFISHLILGLGETCILYYSFISGFIFTSIYLIYLDYFYDGKIS